MSEKGKDFVFVTDYFGVLMVICYTRRVLTATSKVIVWLLVCDEKMGQ